ncbi:acylphosphatase [Thermoplasmatales archaeon SG8-52-2]|nr:MAG: acylphosphatase [Thermoplasmatales archaeon SG8-52-2]
MISSVHVLISGRVQGVFFRANTKQQAEMLGLSGWVRNTKDGKVEAIFEGEEEGVDQIIKWCHKGPSLSKVEKVDVKKQVPTNEYDDFSIRY